MVAALFLVGSAVVLACAVRLRGSGAFELALDGLLSGGATLCFVIARRAAAAATGALGAPSSWAAELLTVGAPLPESPYHGLERVPALALWMLACAAFVYGGGEADEERGPALLGLVLPLLFVAILVFGPATEHGRGTAAVTLGLVGVVLAVVLVGRVVARRLRSARSRN
jgi:hypothetical protein